MSHFTVLVVGDDIEKQLSPFQENNMGDTPGEFLAFREEETEYLEEYQTKTTKMLKASDGRLWSRYDEKFRNPKHSFTNNSSQYLTPEGYLEVEIKFKDLYLTFEEFVMEYHGEKERDSTKNLYGHWYNPNSKWDWYVIGGRWTGYFKAKPGIVGEIGERGVHDKKAKKGWYDSLRKGDIDFEGMRKISSEKAEHAYTIIENTFGGSIPKLQHLWKEIVDDKGLYKDLSMDERRSLYHSQFAMKALEEAKQRARRHGGEMSEDEGTVFWCDLEDFQCTKEKYVQRARNEAGTSFAMVKDGKWYENGEMGWWACVSNEKDTDVWLEEFGKLIDSLPEDALLTAVDCHI